MSAVGEHGITSAP